MLFSKKLHLIHLTTNSFMTVTIKTRHLAHCFTTTNSQSLVSIQAYGSSMCDLVRKVNPKPIYANTEILSRVQR